MGTLARHSIVRHTSLQVETDRGTQFVDVTDEVNALVASLGIHAGIVNIQSLHTTTAVVVNEHEPLLLTDLEGLLDRLAPQSASYRHDDTGLRTVNCVPGERPNGHAHCRALVLTPSVCLNIVKGRLRLGRWQRVFLVELDGPRSRDLSVVVVGDGEQ